jgi:SAM-dependent methyltransferase
MSDPFSDLHQFSDVDATADAARFIAFLEWTDSRPDVQSRRVRSYDLLRVESRARILDVGCGIGTVVGELRARGVEAVGVDASSDMVEQARARVDGAEFLVADAMNLPFPDASFAGYRSERVYQHLSDPVGALLEAHRVLAPGGRIVLVDQDWDALMIDSDDKEIGRAVVLGYSDAIVDGWMGRRSRAALVDAGFDDVQVEVETFVLDYDYAEPFLQTLVEPAVERGRIARGEADDWMAEQQQRARDGRFFGAMSHVIANATKKDG